MSELSQMHLQLQDLSIDRRGCGEALKISFRGGELRFGLRDLRLDLEHDVSAQIAFLDAHYVLSREALGNPEFILGIRKLRFGNLQRGLPRRHFRTLSALIYSK